MSSFSRFCTFLKNSCLPPMRKKNGVKLFILICSLFLIVGAYSYVDAETKLETDSVDEVALPTAAEESIVIPNPYALQTNYIAEKNQRYESYSKNYPELDPADIVWRVNSDLDREFYSDFVEIDSDLPLLVNKYNKLPEDYHPELAQMEYGHLLTPATLEAFSRMQRAARFKGYRIDVISGYRSYEKQRNLYENAVAEHGQENADRYVARPGFSEHQTGRAIDIARTSIEEFGISQEYSWIEENCQDYGFIIRYKEENSNITGYMSEPWHITFVGREIAIAMKNEGISSLEEYVAKNPRILHTAKMDDRKIAVLDAGHGGEDTGATFDGINEKDINLDIALRVKPLLETQGIKTILTREDDVFVDKTDRAITANQRNADVFVSIHQNSYEDKMVKGLEIWYNDKGNGDNHRLANKVRGKILSLSGASDRLLRPDSGNLVVLRESVSPSVLVETGYMSNSEELELLKSDNYKQVLAQGIAEGIVSFLDPKTMYLTFDDGPSPENTPKILDILKEKNIKATFFVVGEKAENNPELIERIVAEGHALGIHCYSHTYSRIYATTEDYISDFNKASDIIYRIVGLRPNIYRFPGGSINNFNKNVYKQIIEEMNAGGFIYYDWNASLEDAWGQSKASDLIKEARTSIGDQNKVILLAHDAYPVTAEALEQVLELLWDYDMKVITEQTPSVQFKART